MKALSLDLRQRIADALAAGQTQTSIAARFAVSLSSVERLARKRRHGQSLAPGVAPGKRPLVPAEQRDAFERLALSRTDWTLQTLADAWQAQEQEQAQAQAQAQGGGKALSPATVLRTLRRLGCSFKKSAASQRKGTKPSATPSERR
jgi:transposase